MSQGSTQRLRGSNRTCCSSMTATFSPPVVVAPDGWPLWTSDVRPGREHDMTSVRADPDLLNLIATWVRDARMSLVDLDYEGEPGHLQGAVPEAQGRESDRRPAGRHNRPRRPALSRRARPHHMITSPVRIQPQPSDCR